MEEIFKDIRKLQGERQTDLRMKSIMERLAKKIQDLEAHFSDPQVSIETPIFDEGMPDVNNES